MPMFTADPPRDEDQWYPETGVRTPDGDVTIVKAVRPGEGAHPVTGRTPENEGTGGSRDSRWASTPVSPSLWSRIAEWWRLRRNSAILRRERKLLP